MKKQNTYRLTEAADRWLTEKAQKDGITKNSLLQIIINKAMESEGAK